MNKKKDDEIAELKEKYELSKQRESLLNEKIKYNISPFPSYLLKFP